MIVYGKRGFEHWPIKSKSKHIGPYRPPTQRNKSVTYIPCFKDYSNIYKIVFQWITPSQWATCVQKWGENTSFFAQNTSSASSRLWELLIHMNCWPRWWCYKPKASLKGHLRFIMYMGILKTPLNMIENRIRNFTCGHHWTNQKPHDFTSNLYT